MRLQREKHLKETTKMALANDEARITANAAHQADRNSHKAMKIATDTTSGARFNEAGKLPNPPSPSPFSCY